MRADGRIARVFLLLSMSPTCSDTFDMNQPLITIARLLLLSLSALAPSLADAQVTYQVNTVADLIDSDTNDNVCNTSANNCSLRAALMQTNARVAAGQIDILLPPGVYLLTRPISGANGADSGGLNLTAALGVNQIVFLTGAGAANTIIDGNQLDGVLQIDAGRTALVQRLTIRNGNRRSPNSGGGIRSRADFLSVSDSVIELNRAANGGGIAQEGGQLGIERSSIRSNNALNGGGFYSTSAATDTEIRNSVLHHNQSTNGGGLFVDGSRTAMVTSTVSNNVANTDGGGIFSNGNAGSTMFIESASVIDNDADHDRDQLGGTGGGIYDVLFGIRVDVRNSLIARNTYLGFFDDDCVGSLNAFGRNLFGTLEGCSIAQTAARGLVAPESIGPLLNNGGPTLTHALLLGSAAINGTLDNGLCFVSTDQRGAPRVAGLRCDVGAYEFGSIVPIVELIFKDGFEQ